VVAIKSLGANIATLASWGRGDREAFAVNDWVEIVEDGAALRGMPGPLARVVAVQPEDFTLTLKPEAGTLPSFNAADSVARHVQLRRWDYRRGTGTGNSTAGNQPQPAPDGALLIEEDKWLSLEDGVQVRFKPAQGVPFQYRPGDYWTIPARVPTGDVEWPGPPGNPEALPPRGVRHHYAPLAVVEVVGDEVVNVASVRNTLNPIGS
jgi:hypothetical protein